jgi:(+)-trans-carveol dehydrogenase
MDPHNWQHTIDINLSGLWHTARAAIPQASRVNSILPTNVNTAMFTNEGTFTMFRPDLDNPTVDARYITGVSLPIDGGALIK